MSSSEPTAGRESIKTRVMSELEKFLYITIYFWVLFLTFDVYRSALLEKLNVTFASQGWAIVNALVLAKITLIVEALYARRRQRDAPLYATVLWHAAILTLVLLASLVLEEVIKAMLRGEAFGAAIVGIGGGHILLPLAVGAIFFIVLIPFCAFQELGRVVGSEALSKAFFGSREGLTVRLVTESDTVAAKSGKPV